MATLNQVIKRLGHLRTVYGGNIEVRTVNYHSDFKDHSIITMKNAIQKVDGAQGQQYIRIGGESR